MPKHWSLGFASFVMAMGAGPVSQAAQPRLVLADNVATSGPKVNRAVDVSQTLAAQKPLIADVARCIESNSRKLALAPGHAQAMVDMAMLNCHVEIRRLVLAITEVSDPAVIDNNIKAVSQGFAPKTLQMVQFYRAFAVDNGPAFRFPDTEHPTPELNHR